MHMKMMADENQGGIGEMRSVRLRVEQQGVKRKEMASTMEERSTRPYPSLPDDTTVVVPSLQDLPLLDEELDEAFEEFA